jgi:hypothetical protein
MLNMPAARIEARRGVEFATLHLSDGGRQLEPCGRSSRCSNDANGKTQCRRILRTEPARYLIALHCSARSRRRPQISGSELSDMLTRTSEIDTVAVFPRMRTSIAQDDCLWWKSSVNRALRNPARGEMRQSMFKSSRNRPRQRATRCAVSDF